MSIEPIPSLLVHLFISLKKKAMIRSSPRCSSYVNNKCLLSTITTSYYYTGYDGIFAR